MLRSAIWLLGISLTISGCGTLKSVAASQRAVSKDCTAGKPNQCAAEKLAWNSGLKQVGPAPWIEWSDVNCPGYDRTAVIYQGTCYSGLFLPDSQKIMVAWRGNFYDSAYTHELNHYILWRAGHDDPNHLDPSWANVTLVDSKLKDAGL
jgi:hypothetical protein